MNDPPPLQKRPAVTGFSPAAERASEQIAWIATLGLAVRGACRRGSPEGMVLEAADTIGEGVAIIELIRDPAGKVVDVAYLKVSGVFEQHTGWQDTHSGRRSGRAPFPEDEWLEGVDRVVRTGEPERWEAYSRHTRRWYRCSLSRVGGEGSQVIVLIFENITGRKNRERNRALLTAVTDDLAGLGNVPDTMKRVGKRIARHFHLPWCLITEPGLDLDTSEIRHVWQAPNVSTLAGSYRIRDYLAGEVLAAHLRGEPTVVGDTQNDKGIDAARFGALGIRSFVAVPLLRHRICRFRLSICDRKVRVWRDDEVELLRELTQRLWARLERAHGEDALRFSEARLRTAAAELEEADRRKNDFLAMVGHELRNPLAAIRNGLLLMRSEKARPESREAALPIVAEQVAHAERLVDDLLDLTRIVHGSVQLCRETVAVQDVLRQAVAMVRPQTEPAGFTIDLRTPSSPLEVLGDRVRLTQVFMNVLDNAVKYSGASRLIEVSAAGEGDAAVVRVRDHGMGIPPEVLPRIFEPFVQAERGSVLQTGLGLGLALVRELMGLHGGEVEARSAGEKMGCELILRLPLCSQQAPGSSPAPGG